jgi:hypothetical protein
MALAFGLVVGGLMLTEGADGAEVYRRALVTYVKTFSPDPGVATAVTVVNVNRYRSCNVRVDFVPQGTPSSPACRLSASLAPGVARDFCTNDQGGQFTQCESTCSPDLSNFEGKAIVSSSDGCGNIAIDARISWLSGITGQAISNPNIVPLR